MPLSLDSRFLVLLLGAAYPCPRDTPTHTHTHFEGESPSTLARHNQSNFKVASVRKASKFFFFGPRSPCRSPKKLTYFFVPLLFCHFFLVAFFCWHFLFDTGVPLRFTAAISPGFTSTFRGPRSHRHCHRHRQPSSSSTSSMSFFRVYQCCTIVLAAACQPENVNLSHEHVRIFPANAAPLSFFFFSVFGILATGLCTPLHSPCFRLSGCPRRTQIS